MLYAVNFGNTPETAVKPLEKTTPIEKPVVEKKEEIKAEPKAETVKPQPEKIKQDTFTLTDAQRAAMQRDENITKKVCVALAPAGLLMGACFPKLVYTTSRLKGAAAGALIGITAGMCCFMVHTILKPITYLAYKATNEMNKELNSPVEKA